jgi:hypothetical protein
LEKIGSAKFDVGTTAKLNCMISKGTGPFTIRWTRDGKNINKHPNMKVKGSKLDIENVKMSDTANYTCYISNSISNASITFNIHIYGGLNI